MGRQGLICRRELTAFIAIIAVGLAALLPVSFDAAAAPALSAVLVAGAVPARIGAVANDRLKHSPGIQQFAVVGQRGALLPIGFIPLSPVSHPLVYGSAIRQACGIRGPPQFLSI